MGGNSTSQSALLRDESHTRSTYDLRSWQGLTDVLRAAKQKLTPEKHAVFRDLVLRYAQQGGDSALKNEIDAVLATLETSQASAALHSESISQSQKVVRPAASRSSRVGRPVPQFTVRQSVLKPVTTPVSIPPVTPTPPQPASRPKPPTPPTPIPEPKPEPEPVAVPPAPDFEPPAPRTSEIAKSEPVVPPTSREESSGAPRSLDEHKARIIEIKRLVNEQVGNPVALVGAHKTLGREYMQALLTALKATGGGGVGADAAMRRLEDVYTALLTDTPEAPVAPSEPELVPESKPEPEPEPVQEATPIIEVVEAVVSSPSTPPEPPVPLPVIEVPRPVPVSKIEPAPSPVGEAEVEPVTTPVSIPPVTPTPPQPASIPKPPTPPTPIPEPKPEPEPVAVPPAPVFESPAPRTSEIAKSEPVVSPAPVVSSLSPQRDVISSDSAIPDHVASSSKEKIQPFTNLSPAARLAALTKDAPKAAPKVVTVPKENVVTPKSEPATFQQTKYTQKKVGSVSIQALAASGIDTDEYEVHQSELASPKITKALHELLDEWNIFNASGFLGIGPSGAEHPLYIRLAPLSMGEILTGRYEGADRKVNTVVHDYVNAWRHEQGIAYTPSETFEHYLRRVVQRIQKRQGTPA